MINFVEQTYCVCLSWEMGTNIKYIVCHFDYMYVIIWLDQKNESENSLDWIIIIILVTKADWSMFRKRSNKQKSKNSKTLIYSWHLERIFASTWRIHMVTIFLFVSFKRLFFEHFSTNDETFTNDNDLLSLERDVKCIPCDNNGSFLI